MTDDYLWDRTGDPDPEVARLEATLGALRPCEPLRPPVVGGLPRHLQVLAPARATWKRTAVTALCAAAATAALVWAWNATTRSAVAPVAPTIVIVNPPSVPVAAPAPAAVEEDAAPRSNASNDPSGPEPAPPPPTSVAPAEPPAAEPPLAPTEARPVAPRPKRTATARRPAGPRHETAARPAPDLPDTPTAQEIKDAVAGVKAEAEACGGRHGALPGTKVGIKLSIAGSTGRVTASTPVGEHAGTPLGECVAAALEKAEFPRFGRASIGVQYPVKMP